MEHSVVRSAVDVSAGMAAELWRGNARRKFGDGQIDRSDAATTDCGDGGGDKRERVGRQNNRTTGSVCCDGCAGARCQTRTTYETRACVL